MRKILVFPGNPTISKYYEDWIDELKNQESALNIQIQYVSSYVLFDRSLNSTEYDNKLIEYYENIFLEQYRQTEEPIILIAHSAGSYFALTLLVKHPEKIKKVILLFPYLGYSDISMLKYISIPYFLDRVFPLAELVSWFKHLFIHRYNTTYPISNHDLVACLRFGVRKCHLYETKKFDFESIRAHKDKIYFFYKTEDKWCPEMTIEKLAPISHPQKINIPHDFIVSPAERARMTTLIETVLREAYL